jgi:hypothetical protein
MSCVSLEANLLVKRYLLICCWWFGPVALEVDERVSCEEAIIKKVCECEMRIENWYCDYLSI